MHTLVNPALYHQQLQQKLNEFRQSFAEFSLPEIAVYESPPEHYRMRAEFRMWHKENSVSYIMFTTDKNKKSYDVTEFPVASHRINALMPPLLATINQTDVLRKKLYQVEFLTTLSGEALITLIYHKPLDNLWMDAAQQLSLTLDSHIVGRSRKQKCVIGKDYVVETLKVGERSFHYQQIESGFTQPNARICEKMLTWAVAKTQSLGGDLLELYCGNGNFTLPLSQNFRRVLATELAKPSLNSALENIARNAITNVAVARMSSEEFVQALDRVRVFKRLQHVNLDDYQFTTIFVDPPRAGLDSQTLAAAQRFDNIIYISCNPASLRRDLKDLTSTHRITDVAVFDQFPYTHHLECGVILQR